MRIEEKLRAIGIVLPQCPVPVAAYVPAQRAGSLIYSSGQTAWINGELKYVGKVGSQVTVEEGYESAKISALNCLSAIRELIDLDKIRIIRVTGYVNGDPEFGDQPMIVNGASELLEKIFASHGKHARSAIGVGSLPSNASVEIEIIAEVIGS